MSDSQERTEEATPKRLKEVRSKGQLSTSRDLLAWVAVGTAMFTLPVTMGAASESTRQLVLGFKTIIENPEPAIALGFLGDGLGAIVPALTPMFIAVVVAILAGSILQSGLHAKKFTVSFKNFDLLAGTKRIFGAQALWEGAKALLKTAAVGIVLYAVIQQLLPLLMASGGLSVASVLSAATDGVATLVQAAVVAGLVLAAVDMFVVLRRNRKRTRMTHREVTDEMKNTDGDPLIKAQRRSKQLAMSRNRMIAAVADSDVVIVNPTHVAVALKYEAGKSAPRVVAKGAGAVAFRIREKAAEHGVSMVQDVPLARAIYSSCDVGHEIPPELYGAVAQILAFVMSLRSRGSARGLHRLSTASL